MNEEEKWKQTAQDKLVEDLRRARHNMKIARRKMKASEEWVIGWLNHINNLKRLAFIEGLDPTQEHTSYE